MDLNTSINIQNAPAWITVYENEKNVTFVGSFCMVRFTPGIQVSKVKRSTIK